MQIFSTSHTHSYRSKKGFFSQAGFTLVELLVSIAIIGIITGVVLVKYSSFDGTVLLKSAAYEIALALRDTQIKSVSAIRGANNSFDYPYGMTFTPGSKTYITYRYNSTSTYPYYNPGVAVSMSTSTIGRGLYIQDICFKRNGHGESCSAQRVDVSFKRPEFESLFYAVNNGGNQYGQLSNIENVKIKVQAETGTSIYVIEVSKLGQVRVYKQ